MTADRCPGGGWSFAWAALLGVCLAACRQDNGESSPGAEVSWDLLAPAHPEGWAEAAMAHSGGIAWEEEGLLLRAGTPMTGIVYPDWEAAGLPLTNYAIHYEARREQGSDFFGTVTFPVGGTDRCVSFVLGGWGGSQVGISSIDGYDASENLTGSSQTFENGRWYAVRVEVREKSLAVWLDGQPVVQTNIVGRQLGMRAGEIDLCMPFGFASFRAQARIRAVRVTRLAP